MTENEKKIALYKDMLISSSLFQQYLVDDLILNKLVKHQEKYNFKLVKQRAEKWVNMIMSDLTDVEKDKRAEDSYFVYEMFIYSKNIPVNKRDEFIKELIKLVEKFK